MSVHKFELGSIVEIIEDCKEKGLRLFVQKKYTFPDGLTPLYALTFDQDVVGKDFDPDKRRHMDRLEQLVFDRGFGSITQDWAEGNLQAVN